jgi:uncharacterized C2H2 Zn-finger protein
MSTKYECPVCKKSYKSEKSFTKHLEHHFEQNSEGYIKAIFKYRGTPPKEVVEALLTDCLSEMFKSVAVATNSESKKLSLLDSFKATMAICYSSLSLANDCVGPCNPRTLSTKHRQLQSVLPAFLAQLGACEEVASSAKHEDELTDAGRLLTSILRDYHLILSEETKETVRKQIADAWCETLVWSAEA